MSVILYLFLNAALAANPQNLDESQVLNWVNKVSGQSSIKTVGDPVPLGGYEGAEVNLGVEWVSVPQFDQKKSEVQTIPSIRLGKGLYQNLDIFVVTTIPVAKSDFTKWGFQARWMPWQAQTTPLMAMVGCNYGFQDYWRKISTKSWGCELLGNVIVKRLKVFSGVGLVRAQTLFESGATVYGANEVERSAAFNKYFAGMTFSMDQYSVGMQIDVIEETSASATLGFRF